MQPVGFIQDAVGNRVFAIIPVAQMNPGQATGLGDPATDQEIDALMRLVGWANTCLETNYQNNILRHLREGAGLGQKALAKRMGISTSKLQRLEHSPEIPPEMTSLALETIRTIKGENARLRPTVAEVATIPDIEQDSYRSLESMGGPVPPSS